MSGSGQRTKKVVEHERGGDTGGSWYTWDSPQKPGKESDGTEDKRKS